ncbi:hypothetical protein B0H65DRAFT_433351 [Neurospora tetraspora]|uniref:Uncharacterized protein n=1 Tax=Neurospora tetraspora TaxID=94610 RepID=A0AAE0J844_9PEZI|nr:hypothetical protein B0H65DRAFT_433351 [Neurospora tetraspora]
MAEYSPTAADVRDFVENIEAAAGFDNSNLGEWWNIIISLHTNLIHPETRTIRPFAEFHSIQPRYRIFAAIAYEWLVTNHKHGTIREALGRIGHTNPGLTSTVTEGMAEHELSRNLRKVRVEGADQSPGNTITSLAEFWVAESTPHPGTTADIHEFVLETVRHILRPMRRSCGIRQGKIRFDFMEEEKQTTPSVPSITIPSCGTAIDANRVC